MPAPMKYRNSSSDHAQTASNHFKVIHLNNRLESTRRSLRALLHRVSDGVSSIQFRPDFFLGEPNRGLVRPETIPARLATGLFSHSPLAEDHVVHHTDLVHLLFAGDATRPIASIQQTPFLFHNLSFRRLSGFPDSSIITSLELFFALRLLRTASGEVAGATHEFGWALGGVVFVVDLWSHLLSFSYW